MKSTECTFHRVHGFVLFFFLWPDMILLSSFKVPSSLGLPNTHFCALSDLISESSRQVLPTSPARCSGSHLSGCFFRAYFFVIHICALTILLHSPESTCWELLHTPLSEVNVPTKLLRPGILFVKFCTSLRPHQPGWAEEHELWKEYLTLSEGRCLLFVLQLVMLSQLPKLQ